MNKQKMFQLLYVVLIISLILFMAWLVFWLQGESAMCMQDPLKYYSTKIDTPCYCVKDFVLG